MMITGNVILLKSSISVCTAFLTLQNTSRYQENLSEDEMMLRYYCQSEEIIRMHKKLIGVRFKIWALRDFGYNFYAFSQSNTQPLQDCSVYKPFLSNSSAFFTTLADELPGRHMEDRKKQYTPFSWKLCQFYQVVFHPAFARYQSCFNCTGKLRRPFQKCWPYMGKRSMD